MSIAEFLLARVAEDEASATERVFSAAEQAPFSDTWLVDGRMYTDAALRIDVTDRYRAWVESQPLSDRAKRVLAECAAKRMMMELHGSHPHDGGIPCREIAVVASVYADHPDYDESWRP